MGSNWRELAKQASMTAVNDQDIEKAFADQASGYVENKVGDLMKDEHRVGFEIVKKNEDNTRMIGIFAFKVNRDLIFAPVFFINGEIKGPLLYRCDTKTFVPANKDWAGYLIESLERTEGTGRSRSRRGDAPPRVDMDRMAFRGRAMQKSSSAVSEENEPVKVEKLKVDLKTVKEKREVSLKDAEADKKRNVGTQSTDSAIKAAAAAEFGSDIEAGVIGAVAADLPRMLSGRTMDGSLREFLNEPYFGKKAAAMVLGAAHGSEDFAAQLVRLYGSADNLFPENYTEYGSMSKQASAAEPELVIHYSLEGLEKSAAVAREYFDQGFYITDTRPTEGLAVVDESTNTSLQHPTEPGFYSVLKSDGTFEDDVFITAVRTAYVEPSVASGDGRLHPVRDYDSEVDDSTSPSNLYRRYNRESASDRLLVKDGKMHVAPAEKIWAVYSGAAGELDSDTIESRSFYYAFVGTSGPAVGPIAVHSVRKVDGVSFCKVTNAACPWRSKLSFDSGYASGCGQMVVNGDLQRSSVDELVFGSDAKFIKVDADKDTSYKSDYRNDSFDDGTPYMARPLFNEVGPATKIDDFIYDNFGLAKVKVTFDGEKKASYNIEASGRKSPDMNPVVMMVKLARDLSVHADTAFDLLRKAREEGSVEFMLGIDKEASRLHLVDHPVFDEGFDSEFGLPLMPTKEYRLRVEGNQQFEPPSAIGDAMNPTTPTGLPDSTVATTEPENLQALADVYKVPHIFEHGVIGTLAETFNAMTLMDKYIPKLEDGVDALGRIKFLLHWCPNDFEKGYGSDDMVNLEAEVDSNFSSQGALLLKLLKRADRLRKSDGSTEGDRDKG